jgi:general L-amino acid transport system permease protein
LATQTTLPTRQTIIGALFSGPVNTLATLLGMVLFALVLAACFNWAVVSAVWVASSDAQCAARGAGACWAVIHAQYRLILFGLYPYEDQWRPACACVLALGAIGLSFAPMCWRARRLLLLWSVTLCGFLILMHGGVLGLAVVSSERWGGFALTLFLYATAILLGFPCAVLLALMRRARSGWLRRPAALLVDGLRTLPTIAILFAVAVLAPFMLPPWLLGDKLTRLVVAFALIFACYEAEVLRAGLQGIPPGQDEAARALGVTYRPRVWLILLPQGVRNTFPSTVNLILSTFKETSVVAVIGFFDFTASAQAAYGNATWNNAYLEVYVFIGATYFVCTLALATVASWIERLLSRHKAAR